MVGHLTKDIFKPEENYNDFYAGHKFEPFPEELALNAGLVLARVDWALDVANDTDARSVLDLCCLDGFASLTLSNKLGLKAVGVDLSEPGIKIAGERARKYGMDAHYFNAPIEHFHSAAKFDLILLFEAIEHFTDVDAVIEVIKAHMKPTSTLLVSTPDAEGAFGVGNEDACHLRIYTHRTTEGIDRLPARKRRGDKPIVSLPDYLTSRGFKVLENEVWNELVHTRVVLQP